MGSVYGLHVSDGCPKLVTREDGSEILRVEYDDAIDLGRGKKRVNFGLTGAYGARDGKAPPSAYLPIWEAIRTRSLVKRSRRCCSSAQFRGCYPGSPNVCFGQVMLVG